MGSWRITISRSAAPAVISRMAVRASTARSRPGKRRSLSLTFSLDHNALIPSRIRIRPSTPSSHRPFGR